MTEDDAKLLQQHFKLICMKCGSDDVVIDASDHGFMGSEYTGWIPGSMTVGCNACGQNDISLEN